LRELERMSFDDFLWGGVQVSPNPKCFTGFVVNKFNKETPLEVIQILEKRKTLRNNSILLFYPLTLITHLFNSNLISTCYGPGAVLVLGMQTGFVILLGEHTILLSKRIRNKTFEKQKLKPSRILPAPPLY
jgi:hypothetical protein